MIRNVSRDDYLLARGANPRTGVVTPTAHSASNSSDESGIMRTRGIAPPAKWRQRGDEWISLEFGQPTPIPTPPVANGSHGAQNLRTPLRISSKEHEHGQGTNKYGPSPRAETIERSHYCSPVAIPTDVPGAYPQTPADLNRAAFKQNASSSHSIPRKPVGSLSARAEQQTSPRDIAAINQDVMEKIAQSVDSARPSSAPSPPKPIPFTPADVGKHLPPLPPPEVPQLVHNTAELPLHHSFLDQRGVVQSKDVLNFVTSENRGETLADKELPCLPTRSGQSQLRQHQSSQVTFRAPTSPIEPLPCARALGPRGMRPEYPCTRTSTPRMAPSADTRPEHPRGGRPMPLPRYNNLPIHQQEPFLLSQGYIKGPRMMNRVHHRPNEADDVFTIGPTTTTTNTTTYMSMNTPKRMEYPMIRPRPHPSFETRVATGPTVTMAARNGQDRIPVTTSINMNMSSGDTMAIPIPHGRTRASSRPQMLGRAEGMHSIPRLNPYGNVNVTTMGPSSQWNPTGMPLNIGNGNVVQSKPLPLDHQQIPPYTMGQGSPESESQPPTISQPDGLVRKCSKCHTGFLKDHQSSVDGAIPLSPKPSAPIYLNTLQERTLEQPGNPNLRTSPPLRQMQNDELNTPIPFEPNAAKFDRRDHSACCPDCCKEQDCHEGCLGHPTPAPSPTRSVRSSQDTVGSGNESHGSAKESDSQSNTSEKVRVGRLAFMRSAFKKSLKDRPSSHSRQNSKNALGSKKISVAELSNPLIDLSTQPLSPETLWGTVASAGNPSAAEAARAAMGLKTKPSTSSDEVIPIPSPLKIKKTRKKKNEATESARNVTAPTPVTADRTRLPSPNESRRVTSGPSLHVTTPAAISGLRLASDKGRNASGASIATIEVQVPALRAVGFGALWEMVLVPFEASKMWLRNHPRVMTLAASGIERGWEMTQVITLTSAKLWGVVFVYSKTGRLKLKRGDTAGWLVLDCMRSAVYGLIFMAIGVAAIRVVKCVLDVMGVLGMVIHAVVWVVKTLLGYGLFW